MKFVIVRDSNDLSGKAHLWHLKTDAGFILAKSTRSFETRDKCAREISDIKRDAALTKVVQK